MKKSKRDGGDLGGGRYSREEVREASLRGRELKCLGEDVLGRANSKHEDFKERMCLVHSMNDEAAEAAALEMNWGQRGRNWVITPPGIGGP